MKKRFFTNFMRMLLVVVFFVFIGQSWGQSTSQFNDGYLTIFKVTSGAALTSSGTAIVAEEYLPTGATQSAPNFSVSLPTSGAGRIVATGTGTSAGAITRSENGRYLSIPGYDLAIGTINTSLTTPQTIRTINGASTVGVGISGTFHGGSTTFRGAINDDGTNFWTAGNGVGTKYSNDGTTVVTVSTTNANSRVVKIFNGQLYCSVAAGIYKVSTGKPTTTGGSVSTLLFTPAATNTSSYGFSISPDGNTVYVADDGASKGIFRYTYDGSAWSTGTQIYTGTGYAGVTVDWSGYTYSTSGANGATIYACNPTTLIGASDNGTTSVTATTLRTISGFNAFRQLDFSPIKQTVSKGANTPALGNITKGNSDVVLFQFNLSADEGYSTFKKVIVAQSGTATIGASNDISNFRLIDDANNNGLADAGELSTPLATGTVAASNITFSSISLASYIAEGSSKNFIIVGDMSASATALNTFIPSIVSDKSVNSVNYTTNLVNAGGSWVTIGTTAPTGNTLTIMSASTTWTGGTTDWSLPANWSNGVPSSSIDVIIPSAPTTQPEITANSNCNNLTIDAGASLTIYASKSLTVAGNLLIKSEASGTGSFIDDGTLIVNGTTSVQRWVKTAGTGWEYVSSPIAAASSSLFTIGLHTLYYADEVNNAWASYLPATMTVMQGYARKYIVADADGDIAKTFTGTLNTGNQSIPVTYTTAVGTNHGWNLVGNPYPSTIDWNLIAASNSDVEGSYYVRSNGNNFGSYVAGVGTVTTTKNIPPMQAFWVRTNGASGTFNLTNGMRIHSGQNIYKTTFDNTLHLTVANDVNGLVDDSYVRFKPEATDGFDSQYDAYKMFASDLAYPQVYTNNGTDDIAINSLSDLVGERSVALGFKTTISGQFTLTSDMVSTFTANGNTVYLEDLQTGAYQDLSANSTYPFTSGVASGFGRFILHFNPTITSISEDAKNEVQLFGYDNEIHVKSLNMLAGDVTVYDILGQVVASKCLSGTTSEVIRLEPKSAVYIVKYTTSSQTITKRIFINQ